LNKELHAFQLKPLDLMKIHFVFHVFSIYIYIILNTFQKSFTFIEINKYNNMLSFLFIQKSMWLIMISCTRVWYWQTYVRMIAIFQNTLNYINYISIGLGAPIALWKMSLKREQVRGGKEWLHGCRASTYYDLQKSIANLMEFMESKNNHMMIYEIKLIIHGWLIFH
jgi:hypothetical protein